MMNSNTVQWSEKINISNRLADYVQHKGSQKKASVSLNISNATISQILGSKWESISDEMWRRVSSGGGGGANEWVMVTYVSVTNKLLQFLKESQQLSRVYGITADAGSVKLGTIQH